MIVSSKIPTKLFLDFCPEIFCTFLGASWKLFGLPGDLGIAQVRKPKGSLKSFQEAPRKVKKFQGRNNFVGILEETIIS